MRLSQARTAFVDRLGFSHFCKRQSLRGAIKQHSEIFGSWAVGPFGRHRPLFSRPLLMINS